jgi:hypothetical protein
MTASQEPTQKNHSSLKIRKGCSVVVKIRKGCLVNLTKKCSYVIDTYHNLGERIHILVCKTVNKPICVKGQAWSK